METVTVIHLFKGHMEGDVAVVDSGISLCCRTFAPMGLGTVIPGEETCKGVSDD